MSWKNDHGDTGVNPNLLGDLLGRSRPNDTPVTVRPITAIDLMEREPERTDLLHCRQDNGDWWWIATVSLPEDWFGVSVERKCYHTSCSGSGETAMIALQLALIERDAILDGQGKTTFIYHHHQHRADGSCPLADQANVNVAR